MLKIIKKYACHWHYIRLGMLQIFYTIPWKALCRNEVNCLSIGIQDKINQQRNNNNNNNKNAIMF